MVCDKDVCEKVVCVCVERVCGKDGGVTKMCVKDGV